MSQDQVHRYTILKEGNGGAFEPTGDVFIGTVDEVNLRLAELTENEGGCYAADSGEGEAAQSAAAA